MTHPSVGAFIVTRDGSKRLPAVIRNAQQYADRVLVLVDDRSVDDSAVVADELGAQAFTFHLRQGIAEPGFNECVARLDTDWVFHLDDDELMGDAFIALLPKLLQEQKAWRFPRYHVYPHDGRYLSSNPYYPDWQTRLVPRQMWTERGGWPERIHGSPAWPFAYATAGIFHYKFLLYTREEREARLAQWAAAWPGAAAEHYRAFSIIEGRDVITAAIPEALPLQSFEGVRQCPF